MPARRALRLLVFAHCGLLLPLLALAAPPAAQAPAMVGGRLRPPRIFNAVRLAGPPPTIDGKLDDAAWQEGEWAGDYTQQLPTEGAKPSEKTELKVLYDDKNVYMAIRAYDDPKLIHRYPTRRDGFAGDIVGVCFDSYFDKRSGFEFDLNAAGTKLDLVLSNEGWDTSWDAVWYGKVGLEEHAWTAEFQVPLSQLRYGTQGEQIWGMHAWRWIDRNGEEDQWNLIPRNSTGRMYNFGELHGIKDLPHNRHVELLPHTVGSVDSRPRESGNPYRNGATRAGAIGLDAKVGLTTNFTLDATVNPDFGQVEADPSVVNLTTYETFFEDKRPFFIEGKRLLGFNLEGTATAGDLATDLAGDMLFYSRRIGQPPRFVPGLRSNEYIDSPDSTSILSAVKVTGKTPSGLSMGIVQSITGRETAHLTFDGVERRQTVEPTTNYFAARVQKDWDKGNTIVGGMVTSTHRWLGDQGLTTATDDALTGAVDLIKYISNRSYVLEAKGAFSRIGGSAAAIRDIETNPVHFFQRSDATHLRLDDATSLSGHAGTFRFARYGNSKWRWAESVRWVSPGLELNDVGYMRQADFIRHGASAGFYQTEPKGVFRQYTATVAREDDWDFGGLRTDGITTVGFNAGWANKWTTSAEVHVHDTLVDTRMLRGGPSMTRRPFTSAVLVVGSDPSRRTVVQGGVHVHPRADRGYGPFVVATLRPTNALSLSAETDYERNVDDLQYVTTADVSGRPVYLLGHLSQRTFGTTFRADMQITPDLSVQYYGSPFTSSGLFSGFKRATDTRASAYADRVHPFAPAEIAFDGAANQYAVSDAIGRYEFANPDFTFRQFRSNAVVRWEFRPGSSLYVVWSQGRTGFLDRFDDSLSHSVGQVWQTPARNVLLVKMSYWFPL